MEVNRNARFILGVMIAHTAGYLISGGISYQFITKDLWEGSDPLLGAYLRTPGNPELWYFAMVWQIPAQIARSFLMALILLPLRETLVNWSFYKRTWFFAGLLFVFTHFSASAPSPANIEGAVYIRPEFIQQGFWRMQPEMILYSLAGGFIFARSAYKKSSLS